MDRSYRISELGKAFGLSRTALLYYHSIGLLSPSERTGSGYRVYSESDYRKLQTICVYRRTGMPLKAIRKIVDSRRPDSVPSGILEHRLEQINELIAGLERQRKVLLAMLGGGDEWTGEAAGPEKFIEILRGLGFSDGDLRDWHAKLEREMPDFHGGLLALLGFSPEEVQRIRSGNAAAGPGHSPL